ncbi:MAG: hypothetical protein KGM42_12660 [Hyphomicrobiales bacterium]|nr:hypothetical protein [Hyphomicrobiales bacterium]
MIFRTRPDPASTREKRIAEFLHEGDPPSGVALEVLCEDHIGTYTVPFSCIYMEGRWLNARTREPIEAEVVGWRAPRV